nr:type III-A CRISPR-associated RAMP protein Csm4 [Pseudoflavonifractor phocaeensis]
MELTKPYFCADTLFSALCHTALLTEGDQAVEYLCSAAAKGALLLSDGMPWHEGEAQEEDQLYLPRPFLNPVHRAEVLPSERKKLKKIKYIPANAYGAYLSSLAGGPYLDCTQFSQDFGMQHEVTKASVPENGDAVPYFVGLFTFEPNCGIYFLMGWEEDELRDRVGTWLELLGMTGVGGKISSGYGTFCVYDTIELDVGFDCGTEWLVQALNAEDAPTHITLSSCLPADSELDEAMAEASYQLLRKGGFIHDPRGDGQPVKKQTQCVFQAGSVFSRRFRGELSIVGTTRGHPVYRYNRPLWLGVKL